MPHSLPNTIHNPPGQPTLSYRVGTQEWFLRRMLQRLGRPDWNAANGIAPLAPISTTRPDDEDATIALLDAFASAADILTFYQERIANEGFVRTATEARSLAELAKSVGYRPRPGLAATSHLAFTLERTAGASQDIVLEPGIKVQNVPDGSSLPQTFETVERFVGRADWNELRPRLTRPQDLAIVTPKKGPVRPVVTLPRPAVQPLVQPAKSVFPSMVKFQVNQFMRPQVAPFWSGGIVRGDAGGPTAGFGFPGVSPDLDFEDDFIQPVQADTTVSSTEHTREVRLTDIKDVDKPEFRLRIPTPDKRDPPAPPVAESHQLCWIEARTGLDEPMVANVDAGQVYPLDADSRAARGNVSDADGDQANKVNTVPATQLFLKGLETGLRPGDVLLFVGRTHDPDTDAPRVVATARTVRRVEPRHTDNVTRVDICEPDEQPEHLPGFSPPELPAGGAAIGQRKPLTGATVDAEIRKKTWSEENLKNFLEANAWDEEKLTAKLQAPTAPSLPQAGQGVYAFSMRLGVFGHNAPPHEMVAPNDAMRKVFPHDWDEGWDIWHHARTNAFYRIADLYLERPVANVTRDGWVLIEQPSGNFHPFRLVKTTDTSIAGFGLSGKVTGLHLATTDGKPLVNTPESKHPGFQLRDVTVHVMSRRLELAEAPIDAPLESERESATTRSFALRTFPMIDGTVAEAATLLARGGLVGLIHPIQAMPRLQFRIRPRLGALAAPRPRIGRIPTLRFVPQIPRRLHVVTQGATSIPLDRLVLGLRAGQPIAVTGEQADARGVKRREVAVIAGIRHVGGYTVIDLKERLQYRYERNTVVVNANVVRSTHGETTKQILGSGDASVPNQRFTLAKGPLTFVPEASASGLHPELLLRVNGVRWRETPSLWHAGPDDRVYVVEPQEDGRAHVLFGDGVHGARLPTGMNNVVATYRSGSGRKGNLPATSLTVLMTRPGGVKEVVNASPGTGGADAEDGDDARDNMPRNVKTLERIVSLSDHEDFARSFAGIGKAQARLLRDRDGPLIHITIASTDGSPLPANSELTRSLLGAIRNASGLRQRIAIADYADRPFNVSMKLVIDPDLEPGPVIERVESAVRKQFAFERRAFGQGVTAAEVLAVAQAVPGVQAVDLDVFQYSDARGRDVTAYLKAAPAGPVDGVLQPAELLRLNPAGLRVQPMEEDA